jgi:hypothetical protein
MTMIGLILKFGTIREERKISSTGQLYRNWSFCWMSIYVFRQSFFTMFLMLWQHWPYKTNTLPILMHKMRISNTQVSSVMLRSKKLEIPGKKVWKLWKSRRMKTKIECHETEPKSSKDRAMHEGDNPSFWDEFIKFTFFSTVIWFHAMSHVHYARLIPVHWKGMTEHSPRHPEVLTI